MKANELRIGNLCEYLLEDKFENPENLWTLNVIDAEDILYLSKYPDCKNYRHIPLTPEVLEKCGLSRDREGWFLSFDLKIYDPLVRNGVGGFCQNDFKIVSILYGTKLFPKGIKYLHQLQNLYFALTGEELTYTP